MEELKIIYGLITSVWQLFKKHGSGMLTDGQWESLVADGEVQVKKYRGLGKQYEMLYRDMFDAVQKYYIRMKGDIRNEPLHSRNE